MNDGPTINEIEERIAVIREPEMKPGRRIGSPNKSRNSPNWLRSETPGWGNRQCASAIRAVISPQPEGWAALDVLRSGCWPSRARVFAEFETNLRRERQLECIAKARAAGVYNGRPRRST
jgi:hypothetical protein